MHSFLLGSAAVAPSPNRAGTVAEPGTVAARGSDGRLQLVLLLGLAISAISCAQLMLGEALRWLSPPDARRPAATSGSPAVTAAAAAVGREPGWGWGQG